MWQISFAIWCSARFTGFAIALCVICQFCRQQTNKTLHKDNMVNVHPCDHFTFYLLFQMNETNNTTNTQGQQRNIMNGKKGTNNFIHLFNAFIPVVNLGFFFLRELSHFRSFIIQTSPNMTRKKKGAQLQTNATYNQIQIILRRFHIVEQKNYSPIKKIAYNSFMRSFIFIRFSDIMKIAGYAILSLCTLF